MSLSIIMFIFFVRCWNDHQQLARKNVIVIDANIVGNEDDMYCSYIDFKLNQRVSSFNDVVGIYSVVATVDDGCIELNTSSLNDDAFNRMWMFEYFLASNLSIWNTEKQARKATFARDQQQTEKK